MISLPAGSRIWLVAGITDILIAWLQDNIDCESGIIFDNDEDKTDSAALLPCIEQAREDVRTLRHLQLLHQNR
ncbi:hypothetical protein [Escherichia coli]|uniref:hypothetical protein n=1 Tax=Escherichia coli TaxID=562 RepID=UPI001F212523|nr:hypothetical protein [Escherichia coli]MDY7506512.1 hypothetical protein [Escherichia coli]MDY7934988.1 hypothetical protein [Escherichia coli]BDY74195.1 hypothetical protein MUTS9_27770 [Escherichia coli]BDY80742.1 hypothetical protein MUTS10_40740 [Escherichia coli]BDY85766.1 hypothetical protein MUTS11_40820 [Escherichia coli]